MSTRAPKTDENYLLIFIFVDPFSKSLVDFLFLLIFQQISTNQQIQQKQINKSTFVENQQIQQINKK